MKISDGPASWSMPTGPNTWRLASLTKALPGPTILLTAGTLSVPIGHGGDRLRAADLEDAVGAAEMAAGDHRLVRIGRQAGDDLVDAGDLGRHDRHDRRREQRIAAARHVAADALDRDHAVAQMDAGQRLDLERQDGRELRLGESAHIGDGEFGIGAGLRRQLGQRRFALGGGDLEHRECPTCRTCWSSRAPPRRRALAHS